MSADDFDEDAEEEKNLSEIKKYESDFIANQKTHLKSNLAKLDKEQQEGLAEIAAQNKQM
jgi:hypothetical protein